MVNTITGATTRNGVNFYSYSNNSYNNELTISKDGEYAGTVFLQTKPFIIGGHCMGLIAKQSMSNLCKVYISTLINKVRPIWRGKDRPSVQKSRLEKLEIELPFKNGSIAFSYMENYIEALEAERIETLEAERIETLEAYLTVTNLKDYHLTKNDEKILDRFDKLNDTKSRVEESEAFQLSQVFNLSSSKKKFNANMIEFGGKFPYVARGDSNNGIRGYITESEEFLNPANTISFGQDTATMFYQKEPYFTGDKIKVLRTKEVELDRYKALYLIASLRKSFSTFSWGSSSFNEKVLKETEVKLPIKNNQINYTFMSDFIRVVEKLVIKELVVWTDKKIAAAKEIVAK